MDGVLPSWLRGDKPEKTIGPRAIAEFWPDATADVIEFRAEVLFKAYCWLVGERWAEKWPVALAHLRQTPDVARMKDRALVLSWYLAEDLVLRGLSFRSLLDDPRERRKFWRAMHGKPRRLRPPTDADLALLQAGETYAPGVTRSKVRETRGGRPPGEILPYLAPRLRQRGGDKPVT